MEFEPAPEPISPVADTPQEVQVDRRQEVGRLPDVATGESETSIAVEVSGDVTASTEVLEIEIQTEETPPEFPEPTLEVQLAQPVAGDAISFESRDGFPWLIFGLAGFVLLLGIGIWRFSGK